jgi:peroxiredoxin
MSVDNVMMRCLLFLLPLLAYGENLTGLWDATVTTDGVHVPFRMQIAQKGSNAQGTLYDGKIEYRSDAGKFEGGKLRLHWNITNADLDATFDGKELKGQYVTTRSHTRHLVKDVVAKRSAPAMENARAMSVAGRWTIKADDNDKKKVWSMTIQQKNADISGAIERLDGDSGTLTGTITGNTLVMSHFSGIRPSVMSGELMADGSLKLMFNEKQPMTAMRDDAALASGVKPIDPQQFTKVKYPDQPFPFSFPDLEGKTVSNTDARFKGKVVLVNITGSWCPNCNDDAPVLDALYKKYKAQGLEVVGLSFESGEVEYDRERVKGFVARNHVTYPILIAGTVDNIATQLPDVVNFAGYPTTFFLDRSGKVKLIHDGFSGPGTGAEYEKLKAEIETEVRKLLASK